MRGTHNPLPIASPAQRAVTRQRVVVRAARFAHDWLIQVSTGSRSASPLRVPAGGTLSCVALSGSLSPLSLDIKSVVAYNYTPSRHRWLSTPIGTSPISLFLDYQYLGHRGARADSDARSYLFTGWSALLPFFLPLLRL